MMHIIAVIAAVVFGLAGALSIPVVTILIPYIKEGKVDKEAMEMWPVMLIIAAAVIGVSCLIATIPC